MMDCTPDEKYLCGNAQMQTVLVLPCARKLESVPCIWVLTMLNHFTYKPLYSYLILIGLIFQSDELNKPSQ